MMKVLVVDDNEVLTGIIKDILEMEQIYHVKTAEDGEEGYTAFLHFNPDIILTDIEMPVKNGLEMIRNIRIHNPAIKTIYMSADSNKYRTFLEEEKSRYKANLLDKPFSFSSMMDLFQEYLEESGEETYAEGVRPTRPDTSAV